MFSEINQHKKANIVIPYKIPETVQFVKTLSRIDVDVGRNRKD